MISVAALKEQLRLSHTTADDVYLANLEAAAVSAIEAYEGIYLGAAGSVTKYLIGTGSVDLWLPELPTAITSVHEASYPGDTLTEILTADDDGFLVRGSRLVRKGGSVWDRGYEYTVVYTRGYLPGAAPERIDQAIRMLVTRWYTNRTGLAEVGQLTQQDEVAKKLLKRRAPRVG